ncbi:MAG: hypothetical protein Q9179_005649, partial [Wetmoreana sp. 5 TL-2023]
MTASSALPPSHPRSPHLTDPSLHAFLAPTFSATTYLNNTLPRPPTSSVSAPTSKPQSQPQHPSLATLASQTQSYTATLNAQTTRLSATLTALTDDILRCSSRLAYEVEVLRGEASTLAEALSERGDLDASIRIFLPNGLPPASTHSPHNNISDGDGEDDSTPNHPNGRQENTDDLATANSEALIAVSKLRSLQRVRSSLQRMKETFSLALSWPMPPSLLSPASLTSGLISVSSPSTQQDLTDAESKGQAALSRIKNE